MWPVTGKPIDLGRFQPFQPLQVLYDFDGPRIFTHQNRQGELSLAHWCDEDARVTRFVVVPTTPQLVERLEKGEVSVREALDQRSCWLLDVTSEGTIRGAWQVEPGDLPPDALPGAGTLLLPSLQVENGRRT